jgi:hypothetical protein
LLGRNRSLFQKIFPIYIKDLSTEVIMLRFVFGFLAGVIATGLLIDRGVNLPDRLVHLINGGEVQQLGRDINHAIKR